MALYGIAILMTITLCGLYLASISRVTSNLNLLSLQMYKSASILAIQTEALSQITNSSYTNLSLRINGIYSKNLSSIEILGYPTSGFYCLYPNR